MLPFIAVLTPLAFQLQGVYRLRRGRSRVDDFFAVLIGSILAVVLGVVSTLYVQAYYASEEAKARGAYEVSQLVWALFLGAQRRSSPTRRARPSASCSSAGGAPASA